MYSEINSAVLDGITGRMIRVECFIGNGIPGIKIIGLANTTVSESKERVKAAYKNRKVEFPNKKITINLSPADLKKEGSHLDLPIFCSIFAASKKLDNNMLKDVAFIGEISLSGEIKGTKGALNMIYSLKMSGVKKIVISHENIFEANLIEEIEIIPVRTIEEVVELLMNNFDKSKTNICLDVLVNKIIEKNTNKNAERGFNSIDFSDVIGQEDVKRIMQIAAAGGHNVLLMGEPGIGKTMCAQRITSIMPNLTEAQMMETMLISSAIGINNENVFKRPIRSPYKTVTEISMFGGGAKGKIGEVTMAHNGVMILDEILEFDKRIIDGFRQPLEDKVVKISRINGNYEYPCDFILIGTANPCPCGYYGSARKCNCSEREIKKYLNKLSGPIIDRIDITYLMSRTSRIEIGGSSSNTLSNGVNQAREAQKLRYGSDKLNGNISGEQLEVLFKVEPSALTHLDLYREKFSLSTRAYYKVLRLSRTIADIDGSKGVYIEHIAEALNYRAFDEMLIS